MALTNLGYKTIETNKKNGKKYLLRDKKRIATKPIYFCIIHIPLRLSNSKLKQVNEIIDNGDSHRKISRKGGAVSTIRSMNVTPRPIKGGRRRKLSEISIRRSQRLIESGAERTPVGVRNRFCREGIGNVSPETIRNILRSDGLGGRKRQRKPFLSDRHRAMHLKFALDHNNWKEEWFSLYFSDETKINRFGSDGIHWV